MRAAVYTRYGLPEVVSIVETARPEPKEDEVLVRIAASTVNRTDCGFRSAVYFVSRFWSGLFKPKIPVLGCEYSGIIEKAGVGVRTLKAGDEVFGYNDTTFGGHAEYICIKEKEAVTTIPRNLSLQESAAISEGAHYALNNIRAAKVSKGQQVLVYGATGAIGSSAVQLLKAMDGVWVTAVCNTRNVALVRSLGADEVIDYQTEDYKQTATRFDFVFDAVGKSSFKDCRPLMKDGGIYISTELGKNGENIFYALYTPLLGKKKVLFPIPAISKEDLNYLKSLVEAGKFRPVIDRTYPLKEIVEAYRYVETAQKTGNVLLKIGE